MLSPGCFRGNQFWRELIWGGGSPGRGCISTAKAPVLISFPGKTGFPGNRKVPASKVLTGRLGLAWDAPDNYLRPRLHCPACPSSELGERGVKMPALQKYSHCSPSLPHPGAVQVAPQP